jgi:hypothetical protein
VKLYIVKYRTEEGKVWGSERYAHCAREAFASFLKAVAKVRGTTLTFISISEWQGKASFAIVREVA